MHGRFAVIKLWPALKTAEDECIARLKITAESLGLECLEVDSFARLVEPPHVQLTSDDVDFVLSLHFETPKRYDIFSFVALWNPLQFFHDWGYRKFTRNILTHDDFLSCSSPWADDHVRRMISGDPKREGPELSLYHSLSEPILPPTTGEGKLFYAGINWERVSKKPQRHGELLKLLDRSGELRIYGPKKFQGVNVWAGYKSYQGPVPFDGVSIVRLINKAGISLVLSSDAHRQSELMSSRLFESLAAGAVIISDENAFARRFFGKTLLYIDTSLRPDEVHAQVQSHLDWIAAEPAKAQELAKQAQEIFLQEFSLDRCLAKIYSELPSRKQRLESLYKPKHSSEKISVVLLMPEFHPKVLERHIANCAAQKHVDLRPVLAVDGRDCARFGQRIQAMLNESPIPIAVETLDFFERYGSGRARSRRRAGSVVWQAIERLVQDEYFCIMGPNEQAYSDHLCSLLSTIQSCDQAGSAWAEMLVLHKNDGAEHADLSEEPANRSAKNPTGFGRFLFRRSALPYDLGTVLPYLDAFSMDLLFAVNKSEPTKRCTLVLDIQDRFNVEMVRCAKPDEERQILTDYIPQTPVSWRTDFGKADTLFDDWTSEQKTKLAVELAHSVPFPSFAKRIGFGLYRFWLKRRPEPN
ncbi:MAG: glycosyltransferase family 1 protein [Acidobacteriia bacterium]|nr:glycosyltransferase family 1 protein [Terriglobia bacterium]